MPSDLAAPRKRRLLDEARAALRTRHYSRRTEEAYLGWMRRYHAFHGRRDPARLGAGHVTAFLNSLAVQGRVAAATQNQALAALLFLYEVLGISLPWLDDLVHARMPARLPVVLTRDEVRAVLVHMQGDPRLMATLMYGCGLRLLECCRLRVKDVDFGRNQIHVRQGKGDKDRLTMLPLSVRLELGSHLERVRVQHDRDLARGAGWVELPGALDLKLPNAGREWPWQCSAARVICPGIKPTRSSAKARLTITSFFSSRSIVILLLMLSIRSSPQTHELKTYYLNFASKHDFEG